MDIIARAALMVLRLMEFAIFAVVLMSWIPQARDSRLGSILRMLTDPILMPIRDLTNKIMGGRGSMLDFSPLFAIIFINILQIMIEKSL